MFVIVAVRLSGCVVTLIINYEEPLSVILSLFYLELINLYFYIGLTSAKKEEEVEVQVEWDQKLDATNVAREVINRETVIDTDLQVEVQDHTHIQVMNQEAEEEVEEINTDTDQEEATVVKVV
jgi:hypothetical protein